MNSSREKNRILNLIPDVFNNNDMSTSKYQNIQTAKLMQ